MAKRSVRRSTTADNNVRSLFSEGNSWESDGDNARDRGYRRKVRPYSENQRLFLNAIDDHELVVAVGPAGTGKTYLAIAKAVEALEAGRIGRIVLTRPAVDAGESLGFLPGDVADKMSPRLTRPAVDAGESLGFLPGDVADKMSPYLRPLYDALNERLGGKRLRALLAEGGIEVAPVAFMRGRTLNNAFVVIDEAQNCTYGQIKMLLTRLGWQSTMVVTGDPDQSDLLPELSGLTEIKRRLSCLRSVAVVELHEGDVVRHPLVGEMLTVL